MHKSLPRSVWALGIVSLLMDASSEWVHALLPFYVTVVLGAGAATLGVLEGLAEATAAIVKLFSGALSDYLGRRKPLVLLGYGLAALTKPFFPLAQTVGLVFTARLIDRLGKGIRGAPRDALIAAVTPPAQRGAAFGLRQSLDSVGAFIGPLLAVALMMLFANDVRAALWLAVVPALLAVVVLAIGVEEPAEVGPTLAKTVVWRAWRTLPRPFYGVAGIGTLFTLARFSEAFLILRASDCGLAMTYAPLVMVVMSAVYALVSYPAGRLADSYGSRGLLIGGLGVLVAADLLLAVADSPLMVFAGTALWGIHMGLTQGLFAKLVADTAPTALMGTAFGIFNLLTGLALLLASTLAGVLWETMGPMQTFLAGAGFAASAALCLLMRR
jgi:MFS family permease